MSKEKIKEDLKREYDKSGAGVGGLMRSMGLGPSDSDFDRMAGEIAKSQSPVAIPTVTFGTSGSSVITRPKIDYSRLPPVSDYKQGEEEYWNRLLTQLGPFRDAAQKYWDEGQYKDAESYYKQGLDRLKDLGPPMTVPWAFSSALLKELGELYLSMGQRKNAKKCFEKIVDVWYGGDIFTRSLDEGVGALWGWEINFDSIAWLFMLVEEYKKVAKLFKDALKKLGRGGIRKEILRYARLGAAYLALGKDKDAREAFKHAEALSVTDEYLSKQVSEIVDSSYQQYGPREQKGDMIKKVQPHLDKLKSLIVSMNDIVDELRDLGLSDEMIRELGGYDKLQPSEED